MGWWQLDCIEASQIIHLTSTSKTIGAMIKTDEKKKHNTCRNMFGIKKGNVGKTTYWALLFFSVVLHLSFLIYTQIKGKKNTYQHEQENNRWCKVLRYSREMPGAQYFQPVTVSGRLSLFAILSGRFSKRLRKISPLNKQKWICRSTNYCI